MLHVHRLVIAAARLALGGRERLLRLDGQLFRSHGTNVRPRSELASGPSTEGAGSRRAWDRPGEGPAARTAHSALHLRPGRAENARGTRPGPRSPGAVTNAVNAEPAAACPDEPLDPARVARRVGAALPCSCSPAGVAWPASRAEYVPIHTILELL